MGESDDRRVIDEEFKKQLVDRVAALEEGHKEIKEALLVNTQLTQNILDIIEATKSFFNFCIKAGRVLKTTAKNGSIVGAAVIAFYHALDAIASHDIGAMVGKWFGRVR